MSAIQPLIPRQLELFYCCVYKALKHTNFIDFDHIHNLTFKCHVHTQYDGYDSYLKSVVQLVLDKEKKNQYLNCSSNYTTSALMSASDRHCEKRLQLEYNFYVIIWLLLLILGLVGNSLVLMVFFKSKKIHRNVENYLVASLAASDLLVTLFVVPVKIHYALHNFTFCAPITVCRLFQMTDFMFFTASMLNILALTITRYITIIKPYDYRKIITQKTMIATLCAIWILSIFSSTMTNVDTEHGNFRGIVIKDYKCTLRHLDHLYLVLLYVFLFFLPCLIMLVLYIHIHCISQSHSKSIRYDSKRMNIPPPPTNNSSISHRRASINKISIIIQQSASFINKKLEARATKILMLLYGSFVCCWLPVVVAIYLRAFKGAEFSTGLYALLQFLPIFHSTIDPFIYGVLHREFKSSLKEMLGISFLLHERRGSGHSSNRGKTLSINTARSNLGIPLSNHSSRRPSGSSSHRPSDSSFNMLSIPTTPMQEELRTEDGYPIYKITFEEHDCSGEKNEITTTPDINENLIIKEEEEEEEENEEVEEEEKESEEQNLLENYHAEKTKMSREQ